MQAQICIVVHISVLNDNSVTVRYYQEITLTDSRITSLKDVRHMSWLTHDRQFHNNAIAYFLACVALFDVREDNCFATSTISSRSILPFFYLKLIKFVHAYISGRRYGYKSRHTLGSNISQSFRDVPKPVKRNAFQNWTLSIYLKPINTVFVSLIEFNVFDITNNTHYLLHNCS